MMNKRICAGLTAALLLVFLAVCGNQQSNTNSNNRTQATSKSTSRESTG